MLTPRCISCAEPFNIEEAETAFLDKCGLPRPVTCPDCRQQLRTAHVNQINLFKRSCDATAAPIVSNYVPGTPYKVYSQPYWWSDDFDASVYGKDYDPKRPFFEQFQELSLAVPRPALFTDYTRDVNSEYTNYAGPDKNCYMIFDGQENEDCYYSFGIDRSKTSIDCYRVQRVELCCEVIDCRNCYNCVHAVRSESCSDSAFISNCIGCKNCFMCSNLTHKQYYFRNRPVSPALYRELRASLASRPTVGSHLSEFIRYRAAFPQKFMEGTKNEDVNGDYLSNCKSAYHCYDSFDLRDCCYCTQAWAPLRDCVDCHECGEAELLYECAQLGYGAYNLQFCMHCLRSVSNLCYCNYCFSSTDLFGCVGLKRKHHCILNRQFSADDYTRLRKQIIEDMKTQGVWGRFFPADISAFPYNLTVAHELHPLSRSEALAKGYTWQDLLSPEIAPQSAALPEDVRQAPDEVVHQISRCGSCGRAYRIIRQELALYRRLELALPGNCFLCRHQERLMSRNPRHLWRRNCSSCGLSLATTYAPMRPEVILCESCYTAALE